MRIFKIILLIFFVTGVTPAVLAENKDIGLRLRSGTGATAKTLSIAVCDKCPSKLYIRKIVGGVGTTYGIELVDSGNAFATNLRVKVNNISGTPVVKAVKRRMTGYFADGPAWNGTWVATLTCGCDFSATTHTFDYTAPGTDIYYLVRDTITAKGLGVTVSLPESCLRRSMNGVIDTANLTAICNILGYDKYISSTSTIDDGRDNFTSPGDNFLDYFVAN